MDILYFLKRLGIVLFIAQITVLLLAGCSSDRAVTLSEITGASDAGNMMGSLGDEDISDSDFQAADATTGSGQDESLTVSGDFQSGAKPGADIPENGTVFVYVCGKVVNPGVYELEYGSRVCDALDAAGGFLEGADEGRINLAGMLFDGEMIYFPEPDEEIPAQSLQGQEAYQNGTADSHSTAQIGTAGSFSGAASGLININTAPVSELTTLPGIGEAKAKAIIKYREDNGAFKDISDVKKVPGIGDGLFSGIQDLICVQ